MAAFITMFGVGIGGLKMDDLAARNSNSSTTFSLLSPTEIEALPDLKWLIMGVLPSPAFGVLYGEPGCGKTFVALSMALTVANGQDWLDRKVKQASILYVAAEGVLGLKTRIQAFRSRFGLADERVRFLAIPIEIMNPRHIEGLLVALTQLDFIPSLIIVDTLARVALGANENDAKDMGKVVAGFDELKRQTSATVLVIHHTTKNGSSERGSSALRGAADVMICCEKQGDSGAQGVSLECTKMKDDGPFKTLGAALEKVPLSGGKSSLVIAGTFDFLAAGNAHADTIIEILKDKFSEAGATHKELKMQFEVSTGASGSTFNRAWKTIKETDKIQIEKVDGRNQIFLVEKAEKNAVSHGT